MTQEGRPTPEDRGGSWRKAFLALWTASFVLLLFLCVAILPGRTAALKGAFGAARIPLPALTVLALNAGAWVPRNLVLVALAWGAGAALAFLLPRGALKAMAGLAVLAFLGVLALGAAGILGTDPTLFIPLPRGR